MKIDAKVTGATAVVEHLKAFPKKLQTKLVSTVERLSLDLQRTVVQQKLSGQVLKVKTGKLRRSIDRAIVEQGNAVTGIVSTNAAYARIHEYGGTIFHPPSTSRLYRKILKDGSFAQNGRFVKKGRANFVTEHQVQGYSIQMPERSFLRSALKDMSPEIQQRILDAVKGAVQK